MDCKHGLQAQLLQAQERKVHGSMITTLHRTPHLELVQDGRWVFTRRPNASGVVALVAITPARELLLVEQYRIPVQATVIELPAGLVGDEQVDESFAVASGRELEEETGWRPASCRMLFRGPSSAGLTNELVTFMQARDLVQVGAGGGVAGERITVHRVPLAGLATWLSARAAEGAFIDHKIYAALWWLAHEGEA
jgi:ADP-ribose pyrophosphatase